MVSFQKTAVVSVEMVSEDHRQDTAACVSLSRSTISKTRTGGFPAPPFSARCRRRRRFSRLGFPCQAVLFEEEPFFPEPLLEETSGAAGAGVSREDRSLCQPTFFRSFFAVSKPEASETTKASPGSLGLPVGAVSESVKSAETMRNRNQKQVTIFTFFRGRLPGSPPFRRLGAARFRARRRCTHGPFAPQAEICNFSNFLAARRSPNRGLSPPRYSSSGFPPRAPPHRCAP